MVLDKVGLIFVTNIVESISDVFKVSTVFAFYWNNMLGYLLFLYINVMGCRIRYKLLDSFPN